MGFALFLVSAAVLVPFAASSGSTSATPPTPPGVAAISTYTTYENHTITVADTYQATQTTTSTAAALSGTVTLWPDLGIRPPPNTTKPFHAGFAFAIKAACSYRIKISSDKPMYFVKILTPTDWDKKQSDPEDETIAPLGVWQNANSIDEELSLSAGDYVLYIYNHAGTTIASYSINAECPQQIISRGAFNRTTTSVNSILLTTTLGEAGFEWSSLALGATAVTGAGVAVAYALYTKHQAAEALKAGLEVAKQTGQAAPSIHPGTGPVQPSIGPGSGQAVSGIGPGEGAHVSPGIPSHPSPKTPSPAIPFPVSGGERVCVHCGHELDPQSVYCPACRMKQN